MRSSVGLGEAMTRGLWRWVDETGGVDRWFARVELRRGEWADVEQEHYEEDRCPPPFWQLPLREDYLSEVQRDPIQESYTEFDRKIMEPGIIIMLGLGAFVFLTVILLATVGVRLGD